MKNNIQVEIVERSSGYWVVGRILNPEGPFETVEEAQKYMDALCPYCGFHLYEKKEDCGNCGL
jgi:hypothetical protein